MTTFKTLIHHYIAGLLLLASSTVLAKAVPERADIDTRYKWDLSDMYVDASAWDCLLYTSPSPRDATLSRMPSSA